MPWIPTFTMPYSAPDCWLWLGWSVLPDVILFTSVGGWRNIHREEQASAAVAAEPAAATAMKPAAVTAAS